MSANNINCTFYLQCKGHLSKHYIPKSIACCNDKNLCNLELKPVYQNYYDPSPEDQLSNQELAFICIGSFTFFIVFTMLSIWLWRRHSFQKCRGKVTTRFDHILQDEKAIGTKI